MHNNNHNAENMPYNFKQVLNAIPDSLLIIDAEGTVLWGNAQVEALLGYSADELVGQSVEVLVPESLRESPVSQRRHYMSAPALRAMADSADLKARAADGRLIPVDIELNPLDWQGQRCTLAVLRSEAILLQQQEKEQQKALRLNEERLRRSQAIAHIGTWDWDIRTGEVVWSDEIFNIFGLDKDEFSASYEAVFSNVHPGDRDLVKMALDASIAGLEPFNIEHRILIRDDQVLHVREVGEVYRDKEGVAVRMLGTVQDITSDKEKRIQLQTSQAIFEHAHEGILTINDRLEITSVNPALVKITEFSEEELCGNSVLMLLPASHAHYHLRPILRCVNQVGSWQGEIELARKFQRLCPVLVSVSMIEDAYLAKQYAITLTDISSIKRNEAQLHNLAHYDQLTKLPNRRLFIKSINYAINSNRAFALHYIDMDGFKQINDSQGHNAGDELLCEIAERLCRCTTEDCVIARLGGDEFAVLQLGANTESSNALAMIMVDKLQLRKDFVEHSLDISASIGISHFPVDGRDALELVKKADQAMYQSKSMGKNTYQRYESSLGDELSYRLQLISDIKKAVDNRGFDIYYQPKANVRHPEVHTAEALIRWCHPELGQISPLDFIPLAEETGLILGIGEYVLEEACNFINRWSNEKNERLRVAINLSARQLHDKFLLSKISRIIERTGILAEQLEFEITESVVMQNVQSTMAVFEHLKRQGASLAIDDFGTGYSSLSYLKRLPVDTLKIDRSFIKHLPDSADDLEIVKAIISMAHNLNIKVVGEGVETRGQRDLLIELGCDQLQGFLIGKPMPARDFKTASSLGASSAYFAEGI